jgi:hypothetical protein
MSGPLFIDRTDRKTRPDWLLISDPQLQMNGTSSNGEVKKQYRFNGEYGEKVSKQQKPLL